MRIIVLFLLIAMALAIACEREIESRDPLRSVPAPLPQPTNVQVTVNAESVELDWTVSDSSGIARYRIYIADTLPQNFRVHDSVTNSFAELTDLMIGRLYYIQIAPVAASGLEGDRSEAVSAAIGYTSILINAGDLYTRSREVTVRINSSVTASQVMLSEDPSFADATYVPWTLDRVFTLSAGDGLKTVYGRLVFADGSHSGEMVEDDITLDTRAVIDSVFYRPSGVLFGVGDTITFGLDASEALGRAQVSFTGVSRVDLFDDGTSGDDVPADGIYHGRYVVPVNTNLYEGVVTGAFADEAGNTAITVKGNELLNINTPPDPVDLNLIAASDSARFQWTASDEPDFDSYRIYTSATLPVDTNSTLLAIISAQEPPVPWYAIASFRVLAHSRIFVFDQHHAATGSNTVP